VATNYEVIRCPVYVVSGWTYPDENPTSRGEGSYLSVVLLRFSP
jgi:hypothetical protein